ncbi:MAG: T9SS type A sorting domain-containing protein [Candidatus Zixiibacteriota bacterium]
MVNAKNIIKKIVLMALLAGAVFTCGSASALEWMTFTSFKEVRRILAVGDTAYIATSGGLLVVNDFGAPGKEYTNINGLGTIDITDVIIDAAGQMWVSGDGRLVKFEGVNSVQFLFLNNEGETFKLHRLVDDGDSLWIGTEIGLVLFSKVNDGGQIQDSYSLFGSLNPEPDVYDVLLTGDSIWLATSSGLAVADRSNPVLMKSPSNWTVFSVNDYPELGAETVRRVTYFEDEIYVGTAAGLFRLDRGAGDTSFILQNFGQGGDITDLIMENDTLFIYADSGLAFMKDGVITERTLSGLSSAPVTGEVMGDYHWAGVAAGGVFANYDDGPYVEYVYTGMPGNNVTDVTVNKFGRVTAVFGNLPAAEYEDGVWKLRSFNVKDRTMDIISDSTGDSWAGTFGLGLYHIFDEGIVNYDTGNSSLSGVSENHKYIVVYDMDTDGRYLYAACYRAFNGYPVAVVDVLDPDNPNAWDSLEISDVISGAKIFTLDYYNGYLGVGSEVDGVFICYIGDPNYKADDVCTQYTTDNSNLLSNLIRNVKFSPVTGELWAATNYGLSRFDSGTDRFIDINLPDGFGPEVMAVEFDSRGNLWVGGKNGLARFADGELSYYTTLNSGLVSNDIINITYDIYTGDIYIATSGGMSRIPSDIGMPTIDVEQVVAFPNPYIIDSDSDILKFNYGGTGKISIYNVAGEYVRELKIAPGQDSYWDGRNDNGEPVAAGVYFFVVTDDEGNSGRGKILLIRN